MNIHQKVKNIIMRWIKRKYRLEPLKGQNRVVKRFLFLPLTLEKKTIWLELVEIEQACIRQGSRYFWKSIKFK